MMGMMGNYGWPWVMMLFCALFMAAIIGVAVYIAVRLALRKTRL
ncbi:hypothetical protein SAMN05880570_4735 [Paenibacillus sp. RU4T]|nr:hypothetical protein SAMN05880555_4733 [Paenibacillus sp. RU4X]SIR76298.1 hypothetical protein SAMN05880570_4735 [Paenibacillus sp. RU4T]